MKTETMMRMIMALLISRVDMSEETLKASLRLESGDAILFDVALNTLENRGKVVSYATSDGLWHIRLREEK